MSFSATNKHNYIEIVNRAVPEFYRETDYRLYGSEEDISTAFLGKLLKAATQNDLLFTVSGYTKEEVAEFFLPEGKTTVTAGKFENKILAPYGLSFDSFASEDEFTEWVTDTLLPDITLNAPSGLLSQMSSVGFGSYSSTELVHEYLIDNLGLFYFFNTSSLSATTTAASLIPSYLGSHIYKGKVATEQEALNMLFRFFWNNRDDSTFFKSFIPRTHATPNSQLSADPYLSGTQMFDAIRVQLETWTDYRLKDHSFYKASLDAVLNSGPFPSKLRDAGPFQRFLKAISLGIADINLILEEIGDLLSIDECPQQFLELLANNIGWRFLTGEYSKWRAQLRNAVLLYKAKGSVLGLDAACKLIFPDGIFAASSVTETWESYIPNLLYYIVKTESHIAKEGLEFASLQDMFDGSWPSGVRFNQAPAQYQDAKDRNYRFLVDGILEHFHNQYEGIVIHGEDFKNLPLWTCLPTVNVPEGEGKGFYHRNYPKDPAGEQGFFVAVPPWEKLGFYRECEFDSDRIEFFCNILERPRSEFGFEVDPAIVQALRDLLTTALRSTYVLSGVPTLPQNNKFRVLTENHQLPPNYEDFVTFGNTTSLKDFDVWNTKSSHLVAAFNASSIDFTVDGFDKFRNKAALEVYGDVLKQFIPLHAVLRLVLYLDIEDEHLISDTECFAYQQDLNLFNTEYLNSNRSIFWAGASGTGDLSTTYINGDGRVLPSYELVDSDFWQVSANDLDRNTSRRKDYRYSIDFPMYVRSGKGMPIAFTMYNNDPSENPYLTNEEYILKGFRYDRQDFEPPSSIVWDNSGFYSSFGDCGRVQQSGDFDLSTLYPARLPGPSDYQCSSWNVRRDNIEGLAEVIISRAIKKDKFFDFADKNYRSYEFGLDMHHAFDVYQKEFSSVLYSDFDAQRYYGGLNFIAYAFGPTLFNHNLYYKGEIVQNIIDYPKTVVFLQNTTGYEPIWEFIIGGSQATGLQYTNQYGTLIDLPSRTYFNDAPATAPWSDIGYTVEKELRYSKEVLSGLEIHQPTRDSQSFIVINDDSNSTTNTVNEHCITIFNTDSQPLELVKRFDASSYLRPQSQQRIEIKSKTKEIGADQILSVKLMTSGTTNDEGDIVIWAYSWADDVWKPDYLGSDEEFTKRVVISGNDPCPVATKLNFHTQDTFTVKSIPCGTVIRSNDLHSTSTEYLLKITNGTTTTPQNGLVDQGLTVYEVSVVDRVLEDLVSGYNKLDINRIFTFWTGLGDEYYSRSASNSEDAFGTSGGSRAEYLEVVGAGNIAALAAPTTITKTIGPTGRDYTTFTLAEADVENIATTEFGSTDLVDSNAKIVFLADAATYAENILVIASLTTDATRNVTFKPASGSEHNGDFASGVRLTPIIASQVRLDHTVFDGLVFYMTVGHSANERVLMFNTGVEGAIAKNCLLYGNTNRQVVLVGGGTPAGSEDHPVIIENCVINSSGTNNYQGLLAQTPASNDVYLKAINNTWFSHSNQSAIRLTSNTGQTLEATVTNNMVLGPRSITYTGTPIVSGTNNFGASSNEFSGTLAGTPSPIIATSSTTPADGDFAIYEPSTGKLLGNPTVVTKTIGPSGRDYTTLALAEAAVETIATTEFGGIDLVAADGAIVFEVDAGTYADLIVNSSLTTDAARNVTYKPATGSEHGGSLTAGVILEAATNVLDIRDDFTVAEGLVVKGTGSYAVTTTADGVICRNLVMANTNANISIFQNGTASNPVRVENCVAHATNGYGWVIFGTSTAAHVHIINCTTLYSFTSYGIRHYGSLANLTLTNYLGLHTGGASYQAVGSPPTVSGSNCFSTGTGALPAGVQGSPYPITITTDISASSTGSQAIYASSTGALVNAGGNDIVGLGIGRFNNFSTPRTDIRGFARSLSSCDPGAFEVSLVDYANQYPQFATPTVEPAANDVLNKGIGPTLDSDVPRTDILGNNRLGVSCEPGAFETFFDETNYNIGEINTSD